MKNTETPETAHALIALLDRKGTLFNGNAPEELVTLCRKLERERNRWKSVAEKLAHSLYCHNHDSLAGECITWEVRDTDALKAYELFSSENKEI